MDIIIKVLIVLAAIALFIGSYLLNKRTNIPPSCENEVNDKCEGCHNINCKNSIKNIEENIKDEK